MKTDEARQFQGNRHETAMTEHCTFIHPCALAEAGLKTVQVLPNMIKKQGEGAHPRKTFIFNRERHNEINSRGTKARQHFRDRSLAAMERIEEQEHTILDF